MKEIGGYFGLELNETGEFHHDALKLNTARNCLEYVLRARTYRKIYIPYYSCPVLLEPIEKCQIAYEYYFINEELDPIFDKSLSKGEGFLYINYFGLKQNTVELLARRFGERLIVDNSQAFFSNRIDNIDTFYSARKFFGVADGSYLYTDQRINEDFEQDVSYPRMLFLLKRLDLSAQEGYSEFKDNERRLNNSSIKKMSSITERILGSIDYDKISASRKENYRYLECRFSKYNMLHLDFERIESVPMAYPLLVPDGKELKKKLISEGIYVATYWPSIVSRPTKGYEYSMASNLVPLPVDQRYKINEMEYVADKAEFFLRVSKD